MNKLEAQTFFQDHSEWLANSWGMTPEGREYKRRFDCAVEAIMIPDSEPALDVDDWKDACAVILRQHHDHGGLASPYIQAIKMTRVKFGCTLVEGKNRVDALRAELCL
jgi:hypothetical protein